MTDILQTAVRGACPYRDCMYTECIADWRDQNCIKREATVTKALAALAAAGYAIVPKDPTDAMLSAGLTKSDAVGSVYSIYRAMLTEAEKKQP